MKFLEETFSARNADRRYRDHDKAARAVLKALLPELGAEIKGGMQTSHALLTASGYSQQPERFRKLTGVLDSELRLIRPTTRDDLIQQLTTWHQQDRSSAIHGVTHCLLQH